MVFPRLTPVPLQGLLTWLSLFAQRVNWLFLQALGDAASHDLDADAPASLRRLQDLDPHSVGAVYDRYFPEVYRYVRYRIDDAAAAEDLASDVFVRLLEALRKKQGPQTNLKGWLIATASNAVNDHLRRRYRRPTETLSESLPDPDTSVHAEVDERERDRAVQAAYAQLTPEQQHVLALRFGLGLSLEETAQQMRKKANAIKALQFRALAALQRRMGEVAND
jgi:RNA polymerase sigma-70 factor, ECF subfamily